MVLRQEDSGFRSKTLSQKKKITEPNQTSKARLRLGYLCLSRWRQEISSSEFSLSDYLVRVDMDYIRPVKHKKNLLCYILVLPTHWCYPLVLCTGLSHSGTQGSSIFLLSFLFHAWSKQLSLTCVS